MDELIRIATKDLGVLLSRHLPTLGSQWRTSHVEAQLSHSQLQRVRERGLTKLEQLDFAALLRIVEKNSYELSQAANLPREGRDWFRELQTVRNKWAHASAEQEPSDDVYRDADTLGRCLRLWRARPESLAAVEGVKSTALEYMTAARGDGATSSAQPPLPTVSSPEHPVPTETVGQVEVRDHVLWTKHIRGDEVLKATLNALSERNEIDLEVDGCHGTWQQMNDARARQS